MFLLAIHHNSIPIQSSIKVKKEKRSSSERRKKSRKREPVVEETNLNNSSKKENVSRSDTENDATDRIRNDISENVPKEKNTNIVKEKKRKKPIINKPDKEKDKDAKPQRKSRDKHKKVVEANPNVVKEESNEVIGVFIHECEVLGIKKKDYKVDT